MNSSLLFDKIKIILKIWLTFPVFFAYHISRNNFGGTLRRKGEKMGDILDKAELNNIIRQIETLQKLAGKKLAEAYRSQDGRGNVNEGLLQQGQAYLKQAETLIEQNIVPILQSLNPAQVASALAAAGASRQLMSQVLTVLNAAKNVAKVGMTAAEICQIINVVVPVLLVITAVAIFAVLYKMWLDRDIKKEGERLLQKYEERAGSGRRYVPFQPNFIPGRL